MKRLSYSDEFLVTDDEVAELVLEYAAALARTADSDVVHIPVVDSAGRETVAALVLGPASEIVALHEEREPVELDVRSTLESLQGRITAHAVPRIVATVEEAPEMSPTYSDEY